MSIDGEDVYGNIKKKVREVERQHEQISQQVYTCEKEISGLTEERENCFVNLALTYLPSLNAESVKQTLNEVRCEVQRIFTQKQERRKTVEQEMLGLQTEKQEKQQTLEEITRELKVMGETRDRLRDAIGKELDGKTNYVELKNNVTESGKIADRNKKRLLEMRQEATDKLPEYIHNNLFMYLVNRNFGTSEYTKKGIFAQLDSWVAGVVNYSENKRNYDFLMTMPELMHAKIEGQQEEVKKLETQVKKIEKEAEDRHGLTKILEEGEENTKTRKGVIESIGKIDEKYSEYTNERKELDNSKDEFHQEAVKKLKDYLKGASITELKEKARATSGTADDKLVGRIEEIDLRVRTLKDEAKGYKQSRDILADKISGLNRIKTKFSNEDYEGSRSYFNDINVNSLLLGYLAGQHSENHVWSNLEENHHFRQVHHSSSSYSSSYDSSSSSSDSSFGSFDSGGGFGGGGFSSGSGF